MSVIFRTYSTIIIYRSVAHLVNNVTSFVMHGVICWKLSPYPRAAQFAFIYDLIIINRYKRGAFARARILMITFKIDPQNYHFRIEGKI